MESREQHAEMAEAWTLEKLGFIECSPRPDLCVGTVRVVFFSKTPAHRRGATYYLEQVRHILRTLRKNNISFRTIKVDWAPETFRFIPKHERYNEHRNILYYHVFE